MLAEMLTVGPQAMKGSYTPLVKKMLDDWRTADSPKLQARQLVSLHVNHFDPAHKFNTVLTNDDYVQGLESSYRMTTLLVRDNLRQADERA